MSVRFLEALKARRSIYALKNTLPVPREEVIKSIKEAVRETPSSFNMQSTRVVILFGEEHVNFWNSVYDAMVGIGLKADVLEASKKKIDERFMAGAGTVLFFECEKVVDSLRKAYPLYAHNFGSFSIESNAMAQYAVWTTLSQMNIGASLQHYNELIEESTKKALNLPADWKIRAQMPFGSIAAPAGEKTYIDDSQRFIVKL